MLSTVYFHDGVERKVGVHFIHQTGDKTAVNPQAALVGHNGRCPCRFCVFTGGWSSFHNHMYYPTKSKFWCLQKPIELASDFVGKGQKI